MTSASIFALCVLDACVTARDELKGMPGFETHPEQSARFGRLGIIEDLARHIAFHEEQETTPAKANERDADRYMSVSAEDFVLFGAHIRRRETIRGEAGREAHLRR